ncbi:putative lipotransmembrane domain protein [Ralstonia insidiosa]|uniref:Lipotransmembrane domain protein n=1 Tax=Ralstonia insidiosa TaxID=190721 RepID=A0AAC9FTT4_9RALS|nr:putative lipotransmembrane domain protein [Ralstonia insidiosa]
MDPPFNRRAGEKPALNDQEIRDVVAFLKTLNDGYPPQLRRVQEVSGA